MSEVAGPHGLSHNSSTFGAAVHERFSEMDCFSEIKSLQTSAKVGVHISPMSQISAHLAGQDISDGRCANGSGVKSQGGHHRRILSGLGSDNGRTTCEWGMDGISQNNAYKLSGTPCSFFGPQTLPPADKRLTYVSKIKQHNSSCVYKQARGVRSRSLHSLGKRVLLWSKKHLLSLRETHVPGQINIRADLLSRGNPLPGEWRLHPEVVQRIWDKYGQERVDLFASEENTHCPLFFSLKGMNAPLGIDALAHPWPETLLYAFPPISLIPPTLSKNQITEGEGAPNSPVMARQDLDSRDSATAVFASVASSSVQRPSFSGGGEDFSSTSGEVESLGLARERSNLNSECDLDHSAC